MADEIVKLDLDDAANKLKDKIKFAFAESIPDEQWEAMIQAELKKFMEDRTERGGYRNETVTHYPAEFGVLAQKILAEVMNDELKKRIVESTFLPDGKTIETLIRSWLDVNKDAMVRNFINEIMGTVASNIYVSMTELATQTFAVGLSKLDLNMPGVPDPKNRGYDTQGNWIG